MNRKNQHTAEYKKELMRNKQDIIDYLQRKTGFQIKLQVQYDKVLGYRYSTQVSLNSFKTYSKWVLESTTKTDIKKELLAQILNTDWKNKQAGQSLKKDKEISKRVHSTAVTIDCVNCGEEKPVGSFHRHMSAPFKQRGGYCPLCFDCANSRAAEIARDNDIHTAIVYLAALYDKPYIKSLADEISAMNLTIVERFGLYFRRLNLIHSVKSKGSTFSNSDIHF